MTQHYTPLRAGVTPLNTYNVNRAFQELDDVISTYGQAYVLAREVQADGFNGDAPNTQFTINELTSDDSDLFTLASDTLICKRAGTFYIEVLAPVFFYGVSSYLKGYLRHSSGGVDTDYYSDTQRLNTNVSRTLEISTVVTMAAGDTLRLYSADSGRIYGGFACSFGVGEVYTLIRIWGRNLTYITPIPYDSAADTGKVNANLSALDTAIGSSILATRSYANYQEQQTSGTDAGGFTSGAWRTRALNTEVSDADSIGSITSNQITIGAGTYEVSAFAVAFKVNHHQTRLQNITAGTTIAYGQSATSSSGADVSDISYLRYKFTVTDTTVIELQHQCQTTKATDGMGQAASLGTEIYSGLELWKIG